MSRSIRSEIAIEASPRRVWTVLTDFGSYPEWNPFIRVISGEVSAGARLLVRIAPPGGAAMTFRPAVTELREGSLLEWLGHLVVPGIIDGRHRFELRPTNDGMTSFVQSERFSGILTPLITQTLERTQRGFQASNAALKVRSEAG
jgi:hypothetical protein